jgi:hypothetical protein
MRRLVLLVVTVAALAQASTASSQTVPDVTVFSPGYFESAELDELVRFSWFAENSQDFFTVEFNEYRTFGWETTYSSRQTVLSSLHLTPEEVGLTPGTWYWRVCFGWYEDPTTCYFDDDIRTLEVEEPEPFLSLASARSTARRWARTRWQVRARARCVRLAESRAYCRLRWYRTGRPLVRYLTLRLDSDGFIYISRG